MSSISRRVLLLALTLCGALALPVVASAADLTNTGGVLTYTGTDASGEVDFNSTGTPGQVRVGSNGDDSVTTSNCTPSGAQFVCDGVTGIVANAAGGDDQLYGDFALTMPMTVDGGSGADDIFGSGGNDTLRGGGGDDFVYGDTGADDVSGGSGIDSTNESDNSTPPRDVTVTLDDAANDGTPGEGDNVHSDVENVGGASNSPGTPTQYGTVTLTGSAGPNSLYVNSGRGNLNGGAGNDSLAGGSQDDTINSVDGFADVVTCGRGNDTVTADQFDTVSDSCENVTTTQVGNANDDKQPTVAWTAPAANATLPTTKATALTVTATDDKGVAKVQFLAGTRIVCEDASAPYTCDYKPSGADSGKQVLSAIAIDTSQNATTALRSVKVARFSPKISEKLSPSKDTKAPFKFRVSGSLTPPAGMGKSEACSAGKISTQFKAGKKTISTRRVDIKSNCTYSVTTTFKNRARFGKASKLKVTVRFTGNSVLAAKTLTSKTVKIK